MDNVLINKECSKCHIVKSIDDFSKCKNKPVAWCKECMKINAMLYYNNNKEKCKLSTIKYLKDNPDKAKQYKNKWANKNKDKIYLFHKLYRENNREKVRQLKRNWDRKAMLNPTHRLSNNIRGNMYHALKGKKGFRKWEILVGYSLQDLINHLTPLLDNNTMTWDNYGSVWHVDHIKPKSWFKYNDSNDPLFKECWSLSNLQPKLRIDNIKKGNRYEG